MKALNLTSRLLVELVIFASATVAFSGLVRIWPEPVA
jgi:hypothetical protein